VAAQANRRFSIAINNYAAIVVAAPWWPRSPPRPPSRSSISARADPRLFDRLDSGELELGIGTFGAVGERFGSAALLEDRFVAVMRRGHPAGRESSRRRCLARSRTSRSRRAATTLASSTVRW